MNKQLEPRRTACGPAHHRHHRSRHGPFGHPDAGGPRRRRDQGGASPRRHAARHRSWRARRGGPALPPPEPQQAQHRPGPEDACRQGSAAEARGRRRRAGLQRATAGDEAARARLRGGTAGQPAPGLRRHLRFQPTRPLCGGGRLRRLDPGGRGHPRGQRAGGIQCAALRARQPRGPRDGPVRLRHNLRRAARAGTHGPRTGGRRADVRDDRADGARRPPLRPHLRSAARRLRISPPAQPPAAAVRHPGRPGVLRHLHQRTMDGLHARGRRGRPVRDRPAVCRWRSRARSMPKRCTRSSPTS